MYMKVLNIGCDEDKEEGSIGLDLRKVDSVDIVADARFLPFKNESFNHVYCSHIIEHFRHREVKDILIEGIRVIEKGGGGLLRFTVHGCALERFYSFVFQQGRILKTLMEDKSTKETIINVGFHLGS